MAARKAHEQSQDGDVGTRIPFGRLRRGRNSTEREDEQPADDTAEAAAPSEAALTVEGAHGRRQVKLLSLFRGRDAAIEPATAERASVKPSSIEPDVIAPGPPPMPAVAEAPAEFDGSEATPQPSSPAGAPPATLRLSIRRPAPIIAALAAVAVAVAFVGGLTYYGAREFTRRASDARASEEAASLAKQNTFTATGEAFNGYIQMLRYADDPIVRSPSSTPEQRVDTMRQLLYLNTNKLESLAIVTRQGIILATTSDAITDVRASEAFEITRANLSPTNSDIILPESRARAYVEFTAPLRDSTGAVWAILYGRADPEALWSQTLRASVDGSRTIIVNDEGRFAAGVPHTLIGDPWKGVPLPNGTVRADIMGVDSICGLGLIGRDTQIDHGWNAATCLPVSMIQFQADRAMGQQGLVTIASSILALVLVAGLLRFAIADGAPTPGTTAREHTPLADEESESDPADPTPLLAEHEREPVPVLAVAENEPEDDAPALEAEQEAGEQDGRPGVAADPDPEPEPTAAPEEQPAPPTPLAVLPTPDVDALQLIDAYEQRNARLSERLRESVQARLMVATAQADEAYRLHEQDPERAAELHAKAMQELEAIRDRELRAVGQEMHPSLIRLGLPGALRALRKDFAESIAVTLEIDALADAVGGSIGRVSVDSGRRLVLFRAARDAIRAIERAGAAAGAIVLRRDGDMLMLTVTCEGANGPVEAAAFAASMLAVQAYGGSLNVAERGTAVTVAVELPAPGVEMPEGPYTAGEPSHHVTEAGFIEDLRRTIDELEPRVEVSISAGGVDLSPLEEELRDALLELTGATVRTLAAAEGTGITVTLGRDADQAVLRVSGQTGDYRFDAGVIEESREIIETDGGFVSVSRHEHVVTVTAEVALPASASATGGRGDAVDPDAAEDEAWESDAPKGDTSASALREALDGIGGALAATIDVTVAFTHGADDGIDTEIAGVLRDLAERAARALAAAGAATCRIEVTRPADDLVMKIEADTGGTPFDAATISESRDAIEERDGFVTVSRVEDIVAVMAEIPASATGPAPAKIVTFAAPIDASEGSLGASLRELEREFSGTIDVALDLGEIFDQPAAIEAGLAGELRMLVGSAIRALAAADAPRCSVSLQAAGNDIYLGIISEVAGEFDAAPITAAGAAIDARGGYCSVSQRDNAVSIIAELSATVDAGAGDDTVKVVKVEPVTSSVSDDAEESGDEPAA